MAEVDRCERVSASFVSCVWRTPTGQLDPVADLTDCSQFLDTGGLLGWRTPVQDLGVSPPWCVIPSYPLTLLFIVNQRRWRV